MKSTSFLLVAILAMVTTACARKEPPSQPDADGQTAEQPNVIEINPTVRSNLGINFAKVQRRAVASTLRVPGAFELQPLARHEYRMLLPGRVSLQVDQYQAVSAGDVLYRFQSPAWTDLKEKILIARQNVAEGRLEMEVASARLDEMRDQQQTIQERLNALASAEFSSAELRTEMERLQGSMRRLEAELRLADAKRSNAEAMHEHAVHRAASITELSERELMQEIPHEGGPVPAYQALDWIEVRAAADGVVERLAVTDGSIVEPSGLVVTTVDPSRVRFRATALQSDMPHIEAGASAQIVPPRVKGISLDNAVEASVFLGLEAHPDQRTITVIANPMTMAPWIHPGVSAFLEIVTDATEGLALAIPASAVVKDGITHVFFRRNPQNPNQAIRVEADLGVSDGRWVVIHSGASLGEEVVLEGAYELKLATTQSGTSQQGGHFHADGSYHGEH